MKELPPIDLDGFDPPWRATEYHWGPPVPHTDGRPWKDHQYHTEILAQYDHDYLGIHLFVQVWDYAQQDDPDQRWQYLLLRHAPRRYVNAEGAIEYTTWGWTIAMEYEVEKFGRVPSYAEVGASVDLWVQSPDILRFLLQG